MSILFILVVEVCTLINPTVSWLNYCTKPTSIFVMKLCRLAQSSRPNRYCLSAMRARSHPTKRCNYTCVYTGIKYIFSYWQLCVTTIPFVITNCCDNNEPVVLNTLMKSQQHEEGLWTFKAVEMVQRAYRVLAD